MLECPEGYSRNWNNDCQDVCGCNNADGTIKDVCEYCCKKGKWYCYRKQPKSKGNMMSRTTCQTYYYL